MNPSDVIAKHRQKIMALPQVEGMALGSCPDKPDSHCIVIYTTSEAWPDGLPQDLEGYRVVTKKIKTGFRPL
ncbi:MAG: hypothetical protein U9Q81_13460 [Pseudomonadota bacterium]|nr:hypothetical protein [Pseudomonadota bacterium]